MSATTDRTMLLRSVPFEIRDSGEDGDGLTLEGYAAVFDSPARIDSWEGCFDESVARGAFKKTLRERQPVLQVNHGRSEDLPIGSIEKLVEDTRGLHLTARVFDVPDTALLREGIKAQAVRGMSFRFAVVKDEWRTADGKLVKAEDVSRLLWSSDRDDPATILSRTLKEVRLFELGPVTFPAYAGTSVALRSEDVAAALTDPQVRADLARILTGTPPASPDEGRAATPPATEPPVHSEADPSLLALASAFDTRKVLR